MGGKGILVPLYPHPCKILIVLLEVVIYAVVDGTQVTKNKHIHRPTINSAHNQSCVHCHVDARRVGIFSLL